MRPSRPWTLAAAAALAMAMWSAAARADSLEDKGVYARVIVDSVIIRSGPGQSYQRVYVAQRGEVFPVRDRAASDYWFRVELPDGTLGWVPGSTVYNHELSDEEADDGRFLPWLFAPPPLMTAHGELSITAGMLGTTFGVNGGGGFLAMRPSAYFVPHFGMEGTLGASIAQGGRLYLGTVGGIVNVFPRSPVVPYVVAGGGFAWSDPNADTFLLAEGSTGVLYGGGGLRFGFRYRITLRIEARAYSFYQTNRSVAQEELTGGLTVFF